jgi:hypothetical protein
MENERPASERQAEAEASLARHQPAAEMSDETRARLFDEHRELRQRVVKLESFIMTRRFDDLPGVERADLREQLEHMNAYCRVLARRV